MNLREAEELLPWWVAGTLSADESRLVQAFIDSGQISARKIDELRYLENGVCTVAENEPAYNPAILNNVMTQLDHLQQESVQPAQVDEKSSPRKPIESTPSLIEKFVEFLQWSMTPGWAKVTIAAQFAVLAVVLVFSNLGEQTTDPGNEFGTAGGKTEVVPDLQLRFQPGVTLEQLQTLLNEYGATIVDSSSALGIYKIDVPEDADLVAIQSELAQHPIVSSVQPEPK